MRQTQDTILEQFAAFFCQMKFEDLPQPVVQKTKMLTLDLLGVTIAGLKMEFPRITKDYLTSLKGIEEATLFGHEGKVPAIHAALANGISAHALDMDDGYRYGGVHAGVAVIPAALAYAESKQLSGKELILAIAMGYEIINRIAKAMNPSHLNRGFHTTGTLGVLGAAAACGVLAGLNKEQMTSALGISALQGAGLLEILHDGSMVKPLHPGKAAMAGILSVEMAKRGAKGPVTALEGPKGLFNAMADEVKLDGLFDNLGVEFYIMDQYIKLHAACRHIHASIDGLLSIMTDNELQFSDIADVSVTTYPVATSFCGSTVLPDTAEGAKFSIAYSTAMAAFYGDVSEDRYAPSIVDHPEIQALAMNIRATTNDRWTASYPRERGATILVNSKVGQSFSVDVPLAKGEPENPASDADFIAKFKQNSTQYSDAITTKVLDVTLALDQHSVEDLTKALSRLAP